MKRKQSILIGICTLGVAAALALPAALAAWDDHQLFHAPTSRPPAAGTLSYEARALPTAYALYRRRQLSGSKALEGSVEPTTAAPLLAEKTRALYDGGVLSESLYKKALARLSAANTAVQRSQDGFSFLLCSEAPQEESPSAIVESEWIDATGIVTRYRITGVSCQDDSQELLERYQVYLGLQTLSDWQPISSEAFSDGTSAAWSAEGQIYLYCCVNEDELQLGTASLPQAEISFSGNILETPTQ